LNDQAVSLLNVPSPSLPENLDSAIRQNLLLGIAYARLGNLSESNQNLKEAQRLCRSSCALIGEVNRARGVVAVQQGNLKDARGFFLESMHVAERTGDRFLESTARTNLGAVAMQQEYYDESIDWTTTAENLANSIQSRLLEEKDLGNLGRAYENMGDLERALTLYAEAKKRATELDVDTDKVLWETRLGDIYAKLDRLTEAEDEYKVALEAVQPTHNVERISVLTNSLAVLSLQAGNLEQARTYIQEAIESSRAAHNRLDELYPLRTSAELDVQSSRLQDAAQKLHVIASDRASDAALKWESEDDLARLYEREKSFHDAEIHYRKALRLLEEARSELDDPEYRLPFLTNGTELYDNYIHFLLDQGKDTAALQLADYGRAQTLAEGLGLGPKDRRTLGETITPETTARRIDGVILFYRLGQKESYLWSIGSSEIRRFRLPPASVIEGAVHRYRKAILELRDVLSAENADGTNLYRMLVAPARGLIPRGAKVVIVPDASLNDLNFETLLVPEPRPHFWIEDVSVVDTYSLRLLGANRGSGAKVSPGSILLLGDPVVADPAYPELRNASVEIADIGKHFPGAKLRVLSREQATPGAYFQSEPQRFDYIHFAAHGTASRVDPLDSAIVLSGTAGQDQAFKLYAREIIRRPLNASLVTISTCYGAGTRTYSGEGLVGLAWAFLQAGAHNVIGALWPVSDDTTPLLMDGFYGALNKGEPPLAALREAKLAMLHSQRPIRKPFYWAPFQLYVGPEPGENRPRAFTAHASTAAN